jgi:DNA-binding transcriptional LysR family regulator
VTLEQLRIFVAVAERLHMTRAAEALHVSQSAASAAVAALEVQHEVRLFDRVGRGLALTDAGRAFLPEAKSVLAQADAAARTLDDLAGLKRGRLALAASQTVASYWLPARMARFAAAHPGIELSLRVGNTAQVAQAVIEGASDLGFVEGRADHPLLRRRIVGGDRVSLYAAAHHPLAGRAVTATDLKAASFALREPGSGTRAHFDAAMAAAGLSGGDLSIVLELPSNEAALAAALGGGLVAAVSDISAEPLMAAGRLTRLDFDMPDRAFTVLSHADRRRSRAATAFVDSL